VPHFEEGSLEEYQRLEKMGIVHDSYGGYLERIASRNNQRIIDKEMKTHRSRVKPFSIAALARVTEDIMLDQRKLESVRGPLSLRDWVMWVESQLSLAYRRLASLDRDPTKRSFAAKKAWKNPNRARSEAQVAKHPYGTPLR
jgi:hypothetical protein